MTNLLQKLILALSSDSKLSSSSRRSSRDVRKPAVPVMAEERIEQAGQGFLKLIFQDNTPCFVDNIRCGHKILLDFGRAYIEDIDVPEITFHIELMQRETEWFAGLDVRLSLNFDLQLVWQPRVEALLARMNDALRARSELDLADFARDWKKMDPRFQAMVIVVG